MPVVFRFLNGEVRFGQPLEEQYRLLNDMMLRGNRVNRVQVKVDRDVFSGENIVIIQAGAYRVCSDECYAACEVRAGLVRQNADRGVRDMALVMLIEDMKDYADIWKHL
jgi:hypothetical protein